MAFKMQYNIDMNLIGRNWHKLTLLTYVFVVPAISFADTSVTICDPATSGKICNPVPKITSIPGLVHTILTGVLKIGIPVVALAIIYCGFLFVKARGKPEEINKAKEALLYTLIGAAILLGSWAIAQMIQETVTGLTG